MKFNIFINTCLWIIILKANGLNAGSKDMEWQIGEKARIHIVFFAYKRLHLKQKKKKNPLEILVYFQLKVKIWKRYFLQMEIQESGNSNIHINTIGFKTKSIKKDKNTVQW